MFLRISPIPSPLPKSTNSLGECQSFPLMLIISAPDPPHPEPQLLICVTWSTFFNDDKLHVWKYWFVSIPTDLPPGILCS